MEEKMSDLKFHEATELIPHMGQQEYERLRDDIAENGMIEPIVVLGACPRTRFFTKNDFYLIDK